MTQMAWLRRAAMRTSALLLLLAFGVGCATNPATGRRQLMLMSEAQEIQLGKQSHGEVVAALGLYDDQELQQYVSDLGQALAKSSERPHLPWTFRVVDDPVVNAFALPGGFIYITRGILAHFNSEAELVSVLGHEIGHVTGRHSANQLSKSQLAMLGLGVGAAIRPEISDYADLAQQGLGLLFLKYGRDAEREADMLGFRYLTSNSYDPRPMADVFTTLEAVGRQAGAGGIPDWMSSHPNPASRRKEVLRRIQEYPGQLGDRVERESYLQRLDGLVFGEDPRQGFFEDNQFLHPEMRFRMIFPSGWKYANQRSAVIAMSPQKDAMVRLTLSDQESVDAAARTFASQQGVQVGGSRRTRIGGRPAVLTRFDAQSQSGPLRGVIAHLGYGGQVFEILGLGVQQSFRSYDRAIEGSLTSFRELKDRRALSVKPDRLSIERLRRGTTLSDLHRRSGAVELDSLALINQVSPAERLPAGSLVKNVVGGERR